MIVYTLLVSWFPRRPPARAVVRSTYVYILVSASGSVVKTSRMSSKKASSSSVAAAFAPEAAASQRRPRSRLPPERRADRLHHPPTAPTVCITPPRRALHDRVRYAHDAPTTADPP